MGEEYEIVDRYGRPTGEKARIVGGGGDSCFGGLITIGVVILILIAGISWLWNSIGAATGIIQPTPTPIPYMDTTISATNAMHAGNFDGNIPGIAGSSDEYPDGMRSGATLTFTGISAPNDGTYSIKILAEYCWVHNSSYTLDVIVNGKKQATLAINDVYADTPTKSKLHNGDNTIQLKLNGNDLFTGNPATQEPNSISSCVNIYHIEVTGDGSNSN